MLSNVQLVMQKEEESTKVKQIWTEKKSTRADEQKRRAEQNRAEQLIIDASEDQ
jgi:hypothetical protein